MASWFVHPGWMLDFGVSQYDQEAPLVRDVALTKHVQTIALTAGGGTSGYSLVQLLYRL